MAAELPDVRPDGKPLEGPGPRRAPPSARSPSGHSTEGSMKKNLFVLGSTVLGLALCTAVAAEAADEVIVEETTVTETAPVPPPPPAPAEVAEAPEENKDKPRGFYAGGGIGGAFFEGPGKNSKIFWSDPNDDNGDGQPDAF